MRIMAIILKIVVTSTGGERRIMVITLTMTVTNTGGERRTQVKVVIKKTIKIGDVKTVTVTLCRLILINSGEKTGNLPMLMMSVINRAVPLGVGLS